MRPPHAACRFVAIRRLPLFVRSGLPYDWGDLREVHIDQFESVCEEVCSH
jgi:hypothetical protein